MRIISQDKKYDLPYENYGFMIDGSDIRAIGIPDVIASYPCRKAAELAMEDIRITRLSKVYCLQFQKRNHFCKEGECDTYRECKKSKSPKYDVILLERPGSEGLSNEDVIRLKQFMDSDKTYYPVEFYKANVDSAAMGFVATEAAEKLGFDYDSDSELARFIYPILNDMEKESPDHVYEFTWKSGKRSGRIAVPSMIWTLRRLTVFYRLSRFLRIRNRFPSRDRKGRYFGSTQEDMEKSNAAILFTGLRLFSCPEK